MAGSTISKICIIGNIAGGKTRLARRLGEIHGLPVTHVDTIQFLPGMIVRPLQESRNSLTEIAQRSSWIIDGYGPLDLIEKRFDQADLVIFIDLNLRTHIWWLIKRQLKNLFHSRPELPEGTNELTLQHSRKLYRTLIGMHEKMRPELLKIFSREKLKNKMMFINSVKRWNEIYENGVKLENIIHTETP